MVYNLMNTIYEFEIIFSAIVNYYHHLDDSLLYWQNMLHSLTKP